MLKSSRPKTKCSCPVREWVAYSLFVSHIFIVLSPEALIIWFADKQATALTDSLWPLI